MTLEKTKSRIIQPKKNYMKKIEHFQKRERNRKHFSSKLFFLLSSKLLIILFSKFSKS